MSLITVKSKNENFRRAGIEFTRAGVELDTAELTQEQVDAIQAEAQLVIVADEAELVGGKKSAKGKTAAK